MSSQHRPCLPEEVHGAWQARLHGGLGIVSGWIVAMHLGFLALRWDGPTIHHHLSHNMLNIVQCYQGSNQNMSQLVIEEPKRGAFGPFGCHQPLSYPSLTHNIHWRNLDRCFWAISPGHCRLLRPSVVAMEIGKGPKTMGPSARLRCINLSWNHL